MTSFTPAPDGVDALSQAIVAVLRGLSEFSPQLPGGTGSADLDQVVSELCSATERGLADLAEALRTLGVTASATDACRVEHAVASAR
jgi:hypothetical protein